MATNTSYGLGDPTGMSGDASMASNGAYGAQGQALVGPAGDTSRMLAMLLAADLILLWAIGFFFKERNGG